MSIHFFKSVKKDNEEILWTGKPKFLPFFIVHYGTLIFLLGIALFIVDIINKPKVLAIDETKISNLPPIPMPSGGQNYTFDGLGLLLIGIGIIFFIAKIIAYSNEAYAYTTQGIIIKKGILNTIAISISYNNIKNMYVDINFFESIVNSGSIAFYTGEISTQFNQVKSTYHKFKAIGKPYEVFKAMNTYYQ